MCRTGTFRLPLAPLLACIRPTLSSPAILIRARSPLVCFPLFCASSSESLPCHPESFPSKGEVVRPSWGLFALESVVPHRASLDRASLDLTVIRLHSLRNDRRVLRYHFRLALANLPSCTSHIVTVAVFVGSHSCRTVRSVLYKQPRIRSICSFIQNRRCQRRAIETPIYRATSWN